MPTPFCFDSLGQLTTNRPSDPDSAAIDTTAYTYDPAGHLASIDVSGGTSEDVAFSIDALGRQASRAVGGATPTLYAYLGTSNQVSSTGTSSTLASYSAIDAIGNRISTGLSDGFACLIADLHGNVAAAVSGGSNPGYLSAFRYDAAGQTLDAWTAGSGAVPVPYRYQGRILQSASGATDLYDFGARSYDPSLGTFTSFDSVSGSAQNPLTLNRYLYALANPATLVDPTGHNAVDMESDACANGWIYDPSYCQNRDTSGASRTIFLPGQSAPITAKASFSPGTPWNVCPHQFCPKLSDHDKLYVELSAGDDRGERNVAVCVFQGYLEEECRAREAAKHQNGSVQFAESVSRAATDPSQASHILLEGCSFLTFTGVGTAVGTACSIANAGLYLYKGKPFDAALAALPGGLGGFKLVKEARAATAGSQTYGLSRYISNLIDEPSVTDTRLAYIVKALYKPGAEVGAGGTADALRYEQLTGFMVKNKYHLLPASERLNALANWVADNPSPSADMTVAQTLAADLIHALEYPRGMIPWGG